MSDTSLEAVDGDLPVNPYSLLEAVNSASNISRNGWVLYLALMTYLMVAVAGVTHQDLLLNSPIKLPILEVDIALARFFAFAPMILLFTHFGMLMQHVMLARKVIAFDESLQPLENSRKPNHPLRLELHSYFFTQALAGPQRSWLFGFFLQAMIWLSLVVIPVLLILYIQVMFLPYHSESVTWGHRIVLVIDVALLFFIGIFLRRADASFFHALFRVARQYPIIFLVTAIIFVAVMLFSFFVATVPYGFMDSASKTLPDAGERAEQSSAVGQRRYFGYSMPFLFGSLQGNHEALFGLFHRNLIAKDLDLVSDLNVAEGEPSINLRGRDLRDAVLDRSDMHQADLTGADLRGARLIKTDLRRAQLTCTDTDRLGSEAGRIAAECARLNGANLSGAKLNGANLQGGDFADVKFEEANLSDSNAINAIFTGANLFGAILRNINMSRRVDLTGATFVGAQMQGAQLTNARMLGADLSGAGLQGAALDHAHLQGAILLGAEMQGANLKSAILYGADLSDVVLTGADLSKARIWMTIPPSSAGTALIDMSNIEITAPRDSEIQDLERHVSSIKDPAVRDQVRASLANLMKQAERTSWGNSGEFTQWRRLADGAAQGSGTNDAGIVSPYGQQLTRYLIKLMCSSVSNDGALASGIVARAVNKNFNANAETIWNRLKNPDCPGSNAIDKDLLQDLSGKVRNIE